MSATGLVSNGTAGFFLSAGSYACSPSSSVFSGANEEARAPTRAFSEVLRRFGMGKAKPKPSAPRVTPWLRVGVLLVRFMEELITLIHDFHG